MTELQQVTFTPDVLARIAPDVSLQRHLAVGVRPNLRNINEYRAIEFGDSKSLENSSDLVFGSSILKSGTTTIINTLSLLIVENLNTGSLEQQKYATIYPQVEILRGRSGAPTEEEMILSQDLFYSLRHCRVIPALALRIDNLGILVKDDGEHEDKDEDMQDAEEKKSVGDQILYPDLDESQWQYINLSSLHSKSLSFAVFLSIKVYLRDISTNSLFDLCFTSCLKALQGLSLPRCYVDDALSAKISIRSRKSNARGTMESSRGNVKLDLRQEMQTLLQLNLPPHTVASNFGLIEDNNGRVIMLSDLEGEAEESTVLSRISIINNDKSINKISLVSNGAITLDSLREAIHISKARSKVA